MEYMASFSQKRQYVVRFCKSFALGLREGLFAAISWQLFY